MAVRAATYAPDRPVPYLIEQAYTQRLTCPIRSTAAGALVAVTSGSVTISMPDGTDLVTATAATIDGDGTAYYDVTTTTDHTLGEGWQVIWALLIDGEPYTFRLRGILTEYVPPNMITAADLYGGDGIPELRHSIPQAQAEAPRGDGTLWAPQVNAAYYEMIRMMLADGRPIWKVREPTGYRNWLLAQAIKNACDSIPAAAGTIWETYRKDAYHRLQRAKAGLRLNFEEAAVATRQGTPVIQLSPLNRPLI